MGNYGGSDVGACPACGAFLPVDAEKCPACGKVFREMEEREDETEGADFSWADHRTCQRCGGVLERGFLEDQSAKNDVLDLSWAAGDPDEAGRAGFTRKRFSVTALRCTRCGNLELKALDRA
ncbi:MAG: hypothetical protein JW929_08085 [Anaerolineales bacterium]|nr:hypothetical protein [Anaerolineales bacterium]